MDTKLTREEINLIVSALAHDSVGKWGDGRGEAIARLLKKLKVAVK